MFRREELSVGIGTPANALLEAYWQPVCLASDVLEAGSVSAIEIMGRRLIVARLLSNDLICMDELCPHRGASLRYGFVEEHSIRCAYHGWAFDAHGSCADRPFETDRNKHIANCIGVFPTMERYGLVFVFFGEGAPPEFTDIDILTDIEGYDIVARRHAALKCNWLRIQENAADSTHTPFLHGQLSLEHVGRDYTGFSSKLLSFGFQPIEFGIIKSWTYLDEGGETQFGFGNLLVFPNQLIIETEVHWRVPISSTRSTIFIVSLVPQNHQIDADFVEIQFVDAEGNYDLATPFGQDAMALESTEQAKTERLGRADFGIQLYRRSIRNAFNDIENDKAPCWPGTIRAINGKFRAFMGGYLPSTGIVKGTSAGPWEHRWKSIMTDKYREFKLDAPM